MYICTYIVYSLYMSPSISLLSGPVDNEMLSLWFQERAIEIEYLSGQVCVCVYVCVCVCVFCTLSCLSHWDTPNIMYHIKSSHSPYSLVCHTSTPLSLLTPSYSSDMLLAPLPLLTPSTPQICFSHPSHSSHPPTLPLLTPLHLHTPYTCTCLTLSFLTPLHSPHLSHSHSPQTLTLTHSLYVG